MNSPAFSGGGKGIPDAIGPSSRRRRGEPCRCRPGLAQQPYPYPVPQQTYPQYPQPQQYQYPQQGYPQQAYPQQAYPQGYAYPQPGCAQPGYGYPQQGRIGAIIGQLLGNCYTVNHRTAVTQ